MKLVFVRHGDPDYDNDTLTEVGVREAEALKEYLKDFHYDAVFCSPLGRAARTCEIALGSMENVQVMDWLREFVSLVDPNGCEEIEKAYGQDIIKTDGICSLRNLWDLLPEYYYTHPELRDYKLWRTALVAEHSQSVPYYDYVITEFDRLLAQHGYVRSDNHYICEKGNHEVLLFFTHFGITSVLLSHLMNVAPLVMIQSTCAAPTGITTVVTEEREKGHAGFRILELGATPHLKETSFSARFVECYEDDGRH